MKKTIILLGMAVTVLTKGHAFGQTVALPAQFGPHQWTATFNIIGEDGNPIAGANVSAQYDVPTAPNSSEPTFAEVKGLTDDNGIFVASHTDASTGLGIVVTKAGYYTTHIGYQFYFDEKRRNPTFRALLKKIGKPIAMYAKTVNENPPVLNQPVGYDLMVGDWVGPYGKGITTDIIFTKMAYRKSGVDYDYKVTVNFQQPADGIQEFDEHLLLQSSPNGQSDFRSFHIAPTDGYQNQLIKERYAHPGQSPQSNYNQNANYYIRVRTVLDSNGNVVSAHYGKIYGDFMQFTYYLNPTPNSRNVEFDPSQNLFGNLPIIEQVKDP